MLIPPVECLIIDETGRSIRSEHSCTVGWDEERGLYQARRKSGLYIESAFDGSKKKIKTICHFFVRHIALSHRLPRCRAPVSDMDFATKHSCPHFEISFRFRGTHPPVLEVPIKAVRAVALNINDRSKNKR